MDLPLFDLRTLECDNDLLGMQCYFRRWTVRDIRQCVSDVAYLRTLPSEQEEILRSPAVYIPDGHVDSMGEILF